MFELRCHHLDRKDELESIRFNRSLHGGDCAKRKKLQAIIDEATSDLQKFEERCKRLDEWEELLEGTLDIHWIDNPKKYVEDWYSNREKLK